ncbi:hypothetical protein JRO89_XS02G0284600 [Xanthoceras sorbifolium]|uniref:Uncharacterized protein n=1 Tax=Xanthoceras sorbifolium TaxID=99658 RepID=A0ABQ8IHD7_9ROSI|nr:hypothetical protein JRO89_XS02G0284000 [Xanthoceras sorbifolium]KAH7576060.1 hypothetical protein JRO89_XS02G0284600 [Xanthoceras sorbifolium]
MLKDLVLDIVLLENKIPKFILEDLVKSANPVLPERYNGYSLSRFTRFFFNYIWKDILIDETFLESYFSEARHFVNLLRLFLQPLERDNTERQADSEAAPSVKKLHQAGIKFKLASSTKNFLDITYSKGTLEIPKLTIVIINNDNMSVSDIAHSATSATLTVTKLRSSDSLSNAKHQTHGDRSTQTVCQTAGGCLSTASPPKLTSDDKHSKKKEQVNHHDHHRRNHDDHG